MPQQSSTQDGPESDAVAALVQEMKKLLASEMDLNLRLEDISETESLFEEGIGLDSIGIMEFVTLLEGHFGFEFSDQDLEPELFANLNVLARRMATKVGDGVGEVSQ